jgi:uncharacterized membrane protein
MDTNKMAHGKGKWIAAGICAAAVAAVCILAAVKGTRTDERRGMETGTGIANPFHSFATLKEAESYAGFDFTVPDSLSTDYASIGYDAIRGDLLEVFCYDADGSRVLVLRKGSGTDDISGDYNTYSVSDTLTVNGRKINVRGSSKESISVAAWTDGTSSYAIEAQDSPLPADRVRELAEGMK